MKFSSPVALRVELPDLAYGLGVSMIPDARHNLAINPRLSSLLRPLLLADAPVPRSVVEEAVFGPFRGSAQVLNRARRRLNELLPPEIIDVEGRGDASLWSLCDETLARQPFDKGQFEVARSHAERHRLKRYNLDDRETIWRQLSRQWSEDHGLDGADLEALRFLFDVGKSGYLTNDSQESLPYDFERLRSRLPDDFLSLGEGCYRLSDACLALVPPYILPGSEQLTFDFPEEGMAALPLAKRLLESRGRISSALSSLPGEADEAEPLITLSSSEWMLGLIDFCPVSFKNKFCRYLFAVLLGVEEPLNLAQLQPLAAHLRLRNILRVDYAQAHAALEELLYCFPHFSISVGAGNLSQYALAPEKKRELIEALGAYAGEEAMARAVFYATKRLREREPFNATRRSRRVLPAALVPTRFDVSQNPYTGDSMDPDVFRREWTELGDRLRERELIFAHDSGLVVPYDSEAARALSALNARSLYLYSSPDGEESFVCRFVPPKHNYRYAPPLRRQFNLGKGRVLVERPSEDDMNGRLYGVPWTDLQRLDSIPLPESEATATAPF